MGGPNIFTNTISKDIDNEWLAKNILSNRSRKDILGLPWPKHKGFGDLSPRICQKQLFPTHGFYF